LSQHTIEQLYHFERSPLLFVFSGPSGVGKDSVVRGLVRRMAATDAPVHFCVTATSRPRRDGEINGVDYVFVSPDEFEHMIAEDELLEHAIVYGQHKGIPRQQVREALASGKDVVMRLDVQGAATIRHLIPEAVLVFISTASEDELYRRLLKRRTESPEQIRLRLETARQEMLRIPEFDYLIINPDNQLDLAIDTAMSIVIAERHSTHPRRVSL